MARHFGWIVVLALLCAPVAATAGTTTCEPGQRTGERGEQSRRDERRPRFVKWWLEPTDRAEIGITDQQSARIEGIWQEHVPAQRERFREIEKLEPVVAQLIKEGVADPAAVEKQVDRLEYLNAEMRKARTIMLYRIHRELTAEQRAKLKAVSERRKSAESKTSAQTRRQ